MTTFYKRVLRLFRLLSCSGSSAIEAKSELVRGDFRYMQVEDTMGAGAWPQFSSVLSTSTATVRATA